MRYNNTNVLSVSDHVGGSGSTVDANQLVSASFQASFGGDTQAAGTFKLQASNDVPGNSLSISAAFTPTNWTDIPTESANITNGASSLLTIANMCYRWIRAVYTSTATGAQTIVNVADVGAAQVSRTVCTGDAAGSLNNKYFLIYSINTTSKVQKNFYVWYNVSGGGTDPALPGKTGIEVDISTGDTNADVATATGTAIAALTNDFASAGVSTATVTITNSKPGIVTNISDGATATGFTFSTPTAGVNSSLNNKYFFLWNAGSTNAYYVWFNIAGIGTDPTPVGKAGIAVAVSAAASASTIGAAMATAIAAAGSSADFTASNNSGTVTVTNKAAGPFTSITDFNSGLTFAITGGGNGTVTVNMNALSI